MTTNSRVEIPENVAAFVKVAQLTLDEERRRVRFYRGWALAWFMFSLGLIARLLWAP